MIKINAKFYVVKTLIDLAFFIFVLIFPTYLFILMNNVRFLLLFYKNIWYNDFVVFGFCRGKIYE